MQHQEIILQPSCQGSTKDKYEVFFATREKEKSALYNKIVFLGWKTFGCAVFIGMSGVVIWYTTPVGPVFYTGSFLACLGILLFSVGICILSTVPTDEFDIDTQLLGHAKTKFVLQTFIGIGVVFLGLIFSSFLPYVLGMFLILIGICLMSHGFLATWMPAILTEVHFTSLLNLAGTLTMLIVSSIYFTLAIDPLKIATSNLYVHNIWLEWCIEVDSFGYQNEYIFGSTGFIYFSAAIYAGIFSIQARRGAKTGWRTASFYALLYSWMVSVGLSCFIINVNAILQNYNTFTVKENVYPNIFASFTILLPTLPIIILGKRHCFTLMARRFEYSVKRLQSDGAMMAHLAASSEVFDASGTRWVFRKNDAKSIFNQYPNEVNRQYWTRGKYSVNETVSTKQQNVTQPVVLEVTVSYRDDIDLSYSARFVNTELSIDCNKSLVDIADPPWTFDEWKCHSFDANVKFDKELETVTLYETVKSNQSSLSDLLQWATANLRVLKWENFIDDLLLKSPRQLANLEEKKQVFALSEPIEVNDEASKIDFFVSHSWDDDPVKKCEMLRLFAEDFQSKNGRYPTFWLDKVCINQADPGNALAVLPINIGACKKMLILMSKSYVRRLWCVWELFTLFTFCNKELAGQRITTLSVETDLNFELVEEMKHFSLDNAHCFSPNEELKLRAIMNDVGLHRLKSCIESVIKVLPRNK